MKLTFIALLVILNECEGHGYMHEPPSRMSAWRRGYTFHTNNDDNGMNCGGIDVQWKKNGGRCGICGDSWSGSRDYERPSGSFVQHKVIPKTYGERDVIDIQLVITASHMGWNEFRICDVAKSGGVEATQECLNQNVLADVNGRTRFYFETDRKGLYEFEVALPVGLTCSHCVLQWKWKCGNNWGCDDLGCGTGHGDYQEEFYACADVSVVTGYSSNVTIGTNATPSSPVTLSASVGYSESQYTSKQTTTTTKEMPSSTTETSTSTTETPTSTTETSTSTTETTTSTTETYTSTTDTPSSTNDKPQSASETSEIIVHSYSSLSTTHPPNPTSSTPIRPYNIHPPNFIPFVPVNQGGQGTTMSVFDLLKKIGIRISK
ncbi:hypothetical protein Btru_016285 [Bulinus truncatus]|nr:hypothetical protein Btru_016285 [Bulinus truncatus]